MLGDLIVCYLFLGGAGAGACLVLAILGLLAPRECIAAGFAFRSGTAPVLRPPDAYRRLLAPGYAAALAALIVGMTCLLVDLGRADRLLLLATSPTASLIAVGAWALALCVLLAAALGCAWAGLGRWRLALVRVLEVAAAAVALAVMAYTGFLLQGLAAVPLWATPWLPVLFVLSSASCGLAIVLAAAQFTGAAEPFARVLRRLAAADAVIIAAEIAVVAAFLLGALAGAGTEAGAPTGTALAARESAQALMVGEGAALFWGGFAVAGLAVPLVLDLAFLCVLRPRPLPVLGAAACVLTGGFILRFCIVEAGLHPVLSLFTSL